jgi:hypothetical protein
MRHPQIEQHHLRQGLRDERQCRFPVPRFTGDLDPGEFEERTSA